MDEDIQDGATTPERHDSKTSAFEGLQQMKHELHQSGTAEALRHNQQAVAHNVSLPTINTGLNPPPGHRSSPRHSPASAGLHIQTAIEAAPRHGFARLNETPTIYETPVTTEQPVLSSLTSPVNIVANGSSLRSNLSTSSFASSSVSPGSALASPYLAAMSDLTPLPSPLVGSTPDSPGAFWRRGPSGTTPGRSCQSSLNEELTPRQSRAASLPTSPSSPPKRKKGYGSLAQDVTIANASAVQENAGKTGHGRHRSISEFVPEPLQNVRQRNLTMGSGDTASLDSQYHMQREAYLAAQRGLVVPQSSEQKLPTPPPSSSSVAESDEADDEQPYLEDGTATDYLEVHCGIQNKRRKFRQLRQLGQGTFSTVMLATRERIPAHPTSDIEQHLDPHRLVAIKIVQHGPAGGADEERIETSLKREVEMLKSVSHPSLIHLKACEHASSRTLLVLTYCPGGDLFELASQKREVLTPSLVQRMCAELVSAVRYLHAHWIVHRDIKLENVLANLPTEQLAAITDPRSHPTPLVTLTDLGLSRRIPSPPESPLLTTRCGSEDYAAPEILLGQPYDGRATDSWALGVLLYALMEGRLPFDAPPGKPERSRNTHRIVRCDWIWCRFGDEYGEWDPVRGKDWEGAKEVVGGLLRKVSRGRKGLEEIAEMEWVKAGVQVEGGLRMREEDEDDEALL